jgi:hypothetical protein
MSCNHYRTTASGLVAIIRPIPTTAALPSYKPSVAYSDRGVSLAVLVTTMRASLMLQHPLITSLDVLWQYDTYSKLAVHSVHWLTTCGASG